IPYNATYAATKAFANTFSESLRGELKGSGVHVTLLAPGPVRTDLPEDAERSLVERLVPDFLWISTEHTAQVSLDALERNKMRIVPGLPSKAMSVAGGPLRARSSRRSWATSTRSSAADNRLRYFRRRPVPKMLRVISRAVVLRTLLTVGSCSTCSS